MLKIGDINYWIIFNINIYININLLLEYILNINI